MKLYSKENKILILVILVLLIFSLNLFSDKVRNFFYFVSAPIQKTLWQTGDNISDFWEGIFREEDFKKESEDLRLENLRLLAENVALRELKEENETLRKALEIGLESDFELAFAKITGKDANQDSILINRGSKDGISRGMAAITQEKVLLGRISEVYDNFSRVVLISDKESSFDAEVSGKNLTGIIRGKGSFKIYLDLIPRDKEVNEGDLIVSSSLGRVYPEGLLVGLVEEVKKTDVQPFQQAEIAPFFDIQELEDIFVILNF